MHRERYPAFFIVLLLTVAGGAQAADPEDDPGKVGFEFPSNLPWLNVSRPLTLAELRGKVVLLDFWTYGCINCIHVLDDLRRLERKYHPNLAVIGVHTPKFDREKEIKALQNIVIRYDIDHPVVNDVEYRTGRYYGMRAWPTQVLLDPRGDPIGMVTGEGNYKVLDFAVGKLLKKFEDELNTSPLPILLEREKLAGSLLAAPGKIASTDRLLAISDTLHHRIVLTDLEGNILTLFGGPEAGRSDGAADQARFSSPQGLAFADGVLYVADTGNHLIRKIDLTTKTVTTIAGDGSLELPDYGEFTALETGLRSPWGLAVKGDLLYIAMAGNHQIWRLDLSTGRIRDYAGSGREGIRDGSLAASRFSQPSGLSIQGDWLYVADAEDSAVRRIHLKREQVETLVGTGLFDFGDKDGKLADARLQHVLGVAALNEEQILITDTYNHKLKLLDIKAGRIRTLAGVGDHADSLVLNEPGGLTITNGQVLIADTNNHRILKYDFAQDALEEFKLSANRESSSQGNR